MTHSLQEKLAKMFGPAPKHGREWTTQPLRAIYLKGYAAGVNGEPCSPPYKQVATRGGSWGARANRVWSDGYWDGRLRDDATLKEATP